MFDNVKIQATAGMEIFRATEVSFTNGSARHAEVGAAVTTYDAAVSGVTTTCSEAVPIDLPVTSQSLT